MGWLKYLWDTIRLMWRGECLQHRSPEQQYRARTSAIPCSACTAAFMVKLEKEDLARMHEEMRSRHKQKDEDGRVD